VKPPPPPASEATVEDVLPGEAAVAAAARRSLDGDSRGARRIWPFLGPAFIAAVAYIDPGNFATNIAGGAKFGYLLLWVILSANLIAMVVQTQSAKLGIATGKNLAELCRERFSRRTSIGLWIQAEVVAMATDIAEVVGAALGEMIAAPLSQRAHNQRALALSGGRVFSTASGLWLRDGSRFVNIGSLGPDGTLREVYLFDFNDRRELERFARRRR